MTVMRKPTMKRDVLLFLGYLLINIICYIIGLVFISRLHYRHPRFSLAFGPLAPVLFVVTYTLLFIIPFNPIPGVVLGYIGLLSFGPFYVTIYTLVADLIGILINYYAAQYFAKYFSENTKSYLKKFSGRKGWWALMATRMTPMTSGFAGADFPSYAAGIIGMPLGKFLVASMTPWLVMDIVYYYGLNILLTRSRIVIVFVILALASLTLTVYTFYQEEQKKLKVS